MPSTVYKGDLAEVSFAPEVGLKLRIGTDSASDVGLEIATVAGNDFTTLTFKAEVNTTLFESGAHKLKFPKNMLVGSQLVFTASGGANADDIDTVDLADTGNGGRVFTIVENSQTTMKISPPMLTPDIGTVGPGNVLQILPYKTPPMDVGMTAGTATESVHTDQFLGIASALTLPETKVDLKRFHVVGLGRDVSVQVPGKITNEGGSFEVAMHTARWLKYCLGHELIHSPNGGSVATTLSSATLAGDSSIIVASKNNIEVNDYIEIRDDAPLVPVVSDHEPDGGTWDGTLTDFEFDNAKPHEARRVIGISENDNTLYLDEPLLYPHAASTDVEVRDPNTSASLPVIVSSTGTITNPVTHLIFSRSTQPSFALEVSQRRRDMDSDETSVDGGVGDTKELTRVFRGCKVTDFTLTTDNDAALRLAVNFNAALCYTDTGRLETSPITRYSSHRMFDDTAATEQGRINSGIAKGTQKPFMFYNGSINLAGQQVAQVLNFTLTGQTGMQAFHTINGQHQATSAYGDQVPFAGARNATLMVEGQTSYEMTMEIGVDDPLFYHKMRSGVEFSVNSENSTTNQIRIEFEKNLTGSTAAGASEKMVILIDDYYIIEAPLQIPEDKGMVKSTLKIMPKAIKVLARDTLPKY
tara:strand:- start:2457 stop:4379 length:1923 start_codon:yes stop_codon:yes gene_type:complete